jgi:phage N-6-adenine-methyltransferase
MSLVGFRAQNHPQQPIRDDVDDRATTPEVFEPLAERFRGFTLDVAAAVHNTKCDRYFTTADNGLAQSWAGERVWCNPPYSAIEPWVRKANAEAENCPVIVMLLPANRTEQGWWQRQVEPYRDKPGGLLRVEFLPGRLRFLKRGQAIIQPNERPPFGCCLLIWSADAYPVPMPTRSEDLLDLLDEGAA